MSTYADNPMATIQRQLEDAQAASAIRTGHGTFDLTISPPPEVIGRTPFYLGIASNAFFAISKPSGGEAGPYCLHLIYEDQYGKRGWSHLFDQDLQVNGNLAIRQVVILPGLILLSVFGRSYEVHSEVRLYEYDAFADATHPKIRYARSMHVNEEIVGIGGAGPAAAYMVARNGVIYKYELAVKPDFTPTLHLVRQSSAGVDMQLFVRRVNGLPGGERLLIEASDHDYLGTRRLYIFVETYFEGAYSYSNYVVLEGPPAMNALGDRFHVLTLPLAGSWEPWCLHFFTAPDPGRLRIYRAVQGRVTPIKIALDGDGEYLDFYSFPELVKWWDIRHLSLAGAIEIVTAPISGGLQFITMTPFTDESTGNLCYSVSTEAVIDTDHQVSCVEYVYDRPQPHFAGRLTVEMYEDCSLRIRG